MVKQQLARKIKISIIEKSARELLIHIYLQTLILVYSVFSFGFLPSGVWQVVVVDYCYYCQWTFAVFVRSG